MPRLINPQSRVDVLHVANLETALCVNGEKILSASAVDADGKREINDLARRMQDNHGMEVKTSRITGHEVGGWSWKEILDAYFKHETEMPEAERYEMQALDKHINTEMLEELSTGLKGALTRSVNRIASLKDEVMGKYMAAGVTSFAAASAATGGAFSNPILANYVTEAAVTAAVSGAMGAYGGAVLVATKAHQHLVENSASYHDKVNDKLMNKLSVLMDEQGVNSPSDLTPKDKAGFLQTLRVSYPDANAETLESFNELYRLRSEQQEAPQHIKRTEQQLGPGR